MIIPTPFSFYMYLLWENCVIGKDQQPEQMKVCSSWEINCLMYKNIYRNATEQKIMSFYTYRVVLYSKHLNIWYKLTPGKVASYAGHVNGFVAQRGHIKYWQFHTHILVGAFPCAQLDNASELENAKSNQITSLSRPVYHSAYLVCMYFS